MDPKKKSAKRRRHQRLHCLRRELGLDDETYRDLLESVCGVRSSKGLDAAALLAVIQRMESSSTERPSYPGRPKNMGVKRRLTKVEALLAEASRPWKYADAIAKRMFDVDRCEWCTDEQLRAIITALVKDAARHGRRT